MIIELFGPPGAGKTTFAQALAARLRERGHVAELVLSYRSAERLRCLDPCVAVPRPHQTAAVVHRLTRPVVEMLTLARHPFVNSHDVSTAVNLIRILPPRNLVWSIRLSQYISRLSHSWYQASAAGHIVLFDQAYVQAVCSPTRRPSRRPEGSPLRAPPPARRDRATVRARFETESRIDPNY